jgi:predicted nucleic acid-binding protein
MAELAARATEIAIALKHPIYDCFYLALAERERAPLISADKRLVAVAKKAKGVEVRAL